MTPRPHVFNDCWCGADHENDPTIRGDGDDLRVRPSDSRAESQAGSNGPSGSLNPSPRRDRTPSAAAGHYGTIVADPPWKMTRAHSVSWRKGTRSGNGTLRLDYPAMSVAAIAALPIGDLAAADAHLYVWTTQRYLWRTPEIVSAWGFEPVSVLAWVKSPTGFSLGGTYGQSMEFIVFAKRGKRLVASRTNRDWWNWPRQKHSAKPEEFQDTVEEVSPGPYLELFARRHRPGWDVWGNEVESDVELTA